MLKDTNPEVIDKVKKLLNHYRGSLKINSEAEALTALDMAKKLMNRYHLDMMMLDEQAEIEITHKEFDKCSVYVIPIWLTNIINVVNNLCNCSCILEKDKQKNGYIHTKVVFVCPKNDLDRVFQMYMFFKKSTYTLANLHVKRICGNYTNWRSFAEGFTSRLLERSRKNDISINSPISDVSDVVESSEDDFEYDEDAKINTNDIVVVEKSKEIKLYEYLKDIREKIEDYINNNIDDVKRENIRTSSKVLSSSYELGRKLAEKQNMTLIGKENQLTQQKGKNK